MLAFPSPSSSADGAHVLCTGEVNNVSSYVESPDGGSTWRPASAAVVAAGHGWLFGVGAGGGGGGIAGSVGGIPSGYLKNRTLMTGPWHATTRAVYSVNATDNTIAVAKTPAAAPLPSWAATPRGPVGLLAFDSGGVAHLGGSSYLATVWVWYSDVPLAVNKKDPCCNGSVVAYLSEDAGASWQWRGEIASKQSINNASKAHTAAATSWPASQEGPNENDVVLLKDGRTLLVVLRVDGGDGRPDQRHAPFLLATSTDRGETWALRAAPAFMLSARPRAVVLPNGALVVSGGRPALSMWVSADGFGRRWEEHDLPTQHNRGLARGLQARPAPIPPFCPEFENATDKRLGWMQSSCYTRLGVLAHDTGLVCYEMQGAASGGQKTPPPECAFQGSQIFCMRFTVAV
jgi:hypothetical protein